ncbi:hypothetical protein V7179_11590 [Priestia megaterium]
MQLLEQVNTALSLLKDLSESMKENPLSTLLILGGFTFNFNFNFTKQPDKEKPQKKTKKKKLS